MKKFNLLILLLLITSAFGQMAAHAQDVIVKTDKTEIKSKVLEITETDIKYKKFEMPDGPTYNINKHDVFMIIYKNGTKEYIDTVKPAPVVVAAPVSTSPVPVYYANDRRRKPRRNAYDDNRHYNNNNSNSDDDNATWDPFRLLAFYKSTSEYDGFGTYTASTVSIEFTADIKVVKDFFNVGFGPVYAFTSVSGDGEGSATASSEGAMVFGSGYLPLNKVIGNTEHLKTGFFPFIRAGYEYLGSTVDGTYTGAGTSIVEFGVDYKFTEDLGITVVTSKFDAFGAGISFNF